jgi:hypothetical protein
VQAEFGHDDDVGAEERGRGQEGEQREHRQVQLLGCAWLVEGYPGKHHPAGALASTFHAKATSATIRAQLINVAARVTRSARRSHLRLPEAWPWAHAWQRLFTTAMGPPATA